MAVSWLENEQHFQGGGQKKTAQSLGMQQDVTKIYYHVILSDM